MSIFPGLDVKGQWICCQDKPIRIMTYYLLVVNKVGKEFETQRIKVFYLKQLIPFRKVI